MGGSPPSEERDRCSDESSSVSKLKEDSVVMMAAYEIEMATGTTVSSTATGSPPGIPGSLLRFSCRGAGGPKVFRGGKEVTYYTFWLKPFWAHESGALRCCVFDFFFCAHPP